MLMYVAEVIVNYLASHVLLVYNESRQKEIIRVYDEITRNLPQEQRREYAFDSTIPDDRCKQPLWHCQHSILSRVYVTAGRLSVCLSDPSSHHTLLLQVCCCGPDGQEISVDCCLTGGQEQLHCSSSMWLPNAGSATSSADVQTQVQTASLCKASDAAYYY